MKKEKLLLFDVDGVIIDSYERNYQAAKAFIKNHSGDEISSEEYRTLLEGNAWKNIFTRAGVSLPENITEDDVDDFFEHYHENKIYTGMKPILQSVAKTNILVVNTSTFISFAAPVFEREGIEELFAAFLGPKSSLKKDDKIRIAMEEFNKSADETIFITDTAGDVLEGKETGVTTVGVTWGYHDRARMEKVQPDHVVDSPEELMSLLT
jgi:phosphoglycolate phosphatase